MSLFRKPTKKIQRRVFKGAEDDEDGDPEPPPPPIISRQRKENKPTNKTALLSFVDEEEDGEVFKVKKSSQSKRLAKKREKEKKQVDDSKYENNIPEVEQNTNNAEKPSKPKKRVTLEGLILSGREALAADGKGDVSDEEELEEQEEDNGGFHRYRAENVRAALAAGGDGIPDAALIHAARKTRQQARELGGEYIPIRPDSDRKPGSRLVRDDDDDGSGDDDEEEGRLHVRGLDLPTDKPKRGTAAVEASDLAMDSEIDEWEEQQMQKAVPAIMDITGDPSLVDGNPFAVAPPPPRMDEGPPHLRPLVTAGGAAPTSAPQLIEALRTRLQELCGARECTAARQAECSERLQHAVRVREARGGRAAPLEATYKRAQAARAYITDLVECLDEKLPQLEALERRALQLHKRRCEYIQERRLADVRDQAQDVLALAARAGSVRQPDPEDKVRRVAEREGRRRARRLKREAAGSAAQHRDGDSSDDELPPSETLHNQTERECIRRLSRAVFSDALSAWRSVRGVCARMSRWRRRDPDMYRDAYVPECLPKLLAPYVRHELILWNPLADEDNEDFERMDWYKCLMMYGVRAERVSSDSSSSEGEGEGEAGEPSLSEESTRRDPDLHLVPSVLHRVLVPKLTELVEVCWDPMCVRACVQLRSLLVKLCAINSGRVTPALRRLAAAATARLSACIAGDVFLPALPPHIVEGAGGAFWRRCLGAGVRLLRAVVALCPPPDQLRPDEHALALIGTLCTAAGAAPAPAAAGAAVALASTLPRSGELRARALQRLAVLARHALNNLQTDNPLHLKALEQARAVLNEAKACALPK